MVSHNDTNSDRSSANSGEVSKEFDKQNALEQRIAQASPEGQRQIKERQLLSAEQQEKQLRNQTYNHKHRVAHEENRLLRQYIESAAPRPDTPESKKQDLQIIKEDAERIVTQREQHYYDQIQKQADSDVRHILSKDERSNPHTHNHDRDSDDRTQ